MFLFSQERTWESLGDRVEIIARADVNATLLGKMDAEQFCDLYLCPAVTFYYQGLQRVFDVDNILPEEIGLKDKDGCINDPSQAIWNIAAQTRLMDQHI